VYWVHQFGSAAWRADGLERVPVIFLIVTAIKLARKGGAF